MKIFAILALLFAATPSPVKKAPPRCLPYGPSVVNLEGVIRRQTFAGPPNFESVKSGDKPETYWVLHLSRPVCVGGDTASDGDEPEGEVSNIQLILSAEQYEAEKGLLNKHVAVRGRLIHAMSGHHHTKVLEEVAAIRAL